jgi:hypothetical protein
MADDALASLNGVLPSWSFQSKNWTFYLPQSLFLKMELILIA